MLFINRRHLPCPIYTNEIRWYDINMTERDPFQGGEPIDEGELEELLDYWVDSRRGLTPGDDEAFRAKRQALLEPGAFAVFYHVQETYPTYIDEYGYKTKGQKPTGHEVTEYIVDLKTSQLIHKSELTN